jgi:nucleoside-diphosphate-sugar epimerase
MHIAILGATSQIAKDLICSFEKNSDDQLTLFARKREAVNDWLIKNLLAAPYEVKSYDEFNSKQQFDAIINFIGVGNPVQAAMMGSSILEVTYEYDKMALDYLVQNPNCRYLFLSSGAAYGSSFQEPVDEHTPAKFPINHLGVQDWYGIAKFYAECRHRSLSELPIVDLRVFNYLSHTQDMEARFLITDIVRAIRDKTKLITSANHIVRDFLIPSDFYQLISKILKSKPINTSVDCFTLEPIDKTQLLVSLHKQFGLFYEVIDCPSGVNATGEKPYYYSLNKRANQFEYLPEYTSLQGVSQEIEIYLHAVTSL